jgi:hypothetical protein
MSQYRETPSTMSTVPFGPAGVTMKSPTLAEWVGDVETFASRQWQREPVVFRPEKFTSPFDLDELDAAFQGGLLAAGQARWPPRAHYLGAWPVRARQQSFLGQRRRS